MFLDLHLESKILFIVSWFFVPYFTPSSIWTVVVDAESGAGDGFKFEIQRSSRLSS